MELNFDALVVGAGYAGAVCARELAERLGYARIDVIGSGILRVFVPIAGMTVSTQHQRSSFPKGKRINKVSCKSVITLAVLVNVIPSECSDQISVETPPRCHLYRNCR